MAIKGATFDLQTVLAKYDGAMYNALSNNHDGYVSWTGSGNPITFTDTNVLTLKNGYILVHGRLIVVDGATDITLNPGSSISSGDGRLVLQIDTSRTNTQTVLNQVEILEEYKATGSSWRALSTDDINALNSGVYEVQLCHFTVSNGTSSGVQIDISTDTIIGNLQADIETLADNLELTGDAVGDLQTDVTALQNLGLSVPIPIAKGGTGATSSASARANLEVPPFFSVTSTQSTFNTTTAEEVLQAVGTNTLALVSCLTTDTSRYTCLVQRGGANYASVLACSQVTSYPLFFKKSAGTWTSSTRSVPDIVQFYIDKSSYSHFGYANLQITTRTNISGDTSFTGATTDYRNIQLNPGIYRMNLYCSFQSSSAVATDVGIGLGNNANRRPTPIEARVQTTGSITKLNASGILKVTSYNDLYSFLIYMGDTVARDIGGYWTIERLG